MSPYVYGSVTRRSTIKRPPRLSLVFHCLYLSTMPPSRKSAQAPFGNTLTDCAFSLIGISPPPGSPRAVPTCCDGTRCFASNLLEVSLQRSTLWPDRSIIVALACRRPTADAPLLHEINARSAHRLITGSERNVVCVLYYSVVNVRLRADSGAVKKESYIFSHMYTERKTGFAKY